MKFAIATVGALLVATGCATSMAADTKAEATDDKAQEQKLDDAHKRLEQAAREVAELSTKMAKDHMPDNFIFLGRNPNRAMLGIGIGGTREAEIDDGVAVLSVSPGGPAATAGLKAGDVIVELNGKSLKRDKNDSPREKLLAAMGKLSPGDEVTVRYTREGKSSIAKLKAEQLPEGLARREMRFRIGPGDGPPKFDMRDKFEKFDFEMPHGIAGLIHGGAFGDLELVPLTPKLGQYFGADKGLLVVRAPEGKDQKLEDGDVLIDIDGRVPANPGHAFRILGSYQPGEKVTLNVLRQRKKTILALTVPEHEGHGPRVLRERVERGLERNLDRMPPKSPPAPPPV